MRSKHICPSCGGKTFYTTAHVTQTWKVDEEGNFLDAITSCDDVTYEPDDDNIWTCANCGAEGVIDNDNNDGDKLIPAKWSEYNPKNIEIKLSFYDEDEYYVTTLLSVFDLFKDWIGVADKCPPNETMLVDVVLQYDGEPKSMIRLISGSKIIIFEDLMEAIKSTWPDLIK